MLFGKAAPAALIEYKSRDRGAGVADFQAKLHQLGCQITIDGKFGPQTEKIVKMFQRENRLSVIGKVTSALLGGMDELCRLKQAAPGQLTSGSFRNPGSTRMAVRLLQTSDAERQRCTSKNRCRRQLWTYDQKKRLRTSNVPIDWRAMESPGLSP